MNGGQVAFERNGHVELLHGYLPFDPSHNEIFDELGQGSLTLETGAASYLDRVIGIEETQFVVLTGDSGHGKTHLCRRLIRKHLGYDVEATANAIGKLCDGRALLPAKGFETRRPLRVFKDISERSPEVARKMITEALDDSNSVTVVCANEGRLRSILSGGGPKLDHLKRAFSESFRSGLTSSDGQLYILNLNYQSVATEEDSIIERIFSGEASQDGWLSEKSWSICGKCDAAPHCPIKRNASLLTGQDGAIRRRRIRDALAIAEQLGIVITIREVLMTVAYLMTGGLGCGDVERLCDKSHGRDGWQYEYAFYNLLFNRPSTLSGDQVAGIPVLPQLRALDPGLIAERSVDERLINDPDNFPDASFELLFNPIGALRGDPIDARNSIDGILANPRNKTERSLEESFTREVVRALRRRDFFEFAPTERVDARRLGVNFYDDFRWLLSGEEGSSRRVKIKNQLIAGLHTMQGLRMPRGEALILHVVDPAFGRSTNHAAIIAEEVSPADVKLIRQSQAFAGDVTEFIESHALSEALDWIDRVVVFSVKTSTGFLNYEMDLLTFDCIMRAESGYLPATFYSHDIRRVMNFLSLLSGRSGESSNGQIDVMISGKMKPVVLQEGDLISIGSALI